jgi:hypothetical protein
VHLGERTRMEHFLLGSQLIFAAQIKPACHKLPFYVATAGLGTKSRLPGI